MTFAAYAEMVYVYVVVTYLWVQVHPCMPGTMTVNGKSITCCTILMQAVVDCEHYRHTAVQLLCTHVYIPP